MAINMGYFQRWRRLLYAVFGLILAVTIVGFRPPRIPRMLVPIHAGFNVISNKYWNTRVLPPLQISIPLPTVDTESKIPDIVDPLPTVDTESKIPDIVDPLPTVDTDSKTPDIVDGSKEEDDTTTITLVTAYFDLGTVKRQGKGQVRTNKMYLNWAKIYQHVENPLVCYTDDKDLFKLMKSIREGKENKTKIFLIERNSTWAFQREPRVKEIFSQPGYPRAHPFTGTSGYPCVQFAKYDLIVRAAKENFYKTKYIAWIDIGHFKGRHSKKDFKLVKLDSHNDSCIAMSQTFKVSLNVTPKKIFYQNKIWVGGALAFGTREKMIMFAGQFKRAVDYFLSKNMISTDEQVIYAMFTKQGRKEINPEVELQYNQASGFFGLGTKMIREL